MVPHSCVHASAGCHTQVPADLGGNDYLAPIDEATKDINVQIIFCNAGYLLTGFFHTRWVTGSIQDGMEGSRAACSV